MTRFASVWLVVLLMVMAVGASAQPLVSPEAYGLPDTLFSLLDLNLLYERKDLSPAQRTDVLVQWLTRERAHPSLADQGFDAGRVNSGYIQALTILTLGELGDPKALTAWAKSEAVTDEGVHDGIICALGIMGDASRIPRLIEILQTQKEGDLRAMAARALQMTRGSGTSPVWQVSICMQHGSSCR